MRKKRNISDSEWLILRCLWKQPAITLREIHAILQGTTTWSKNTIRSLIVRLVEKGVVGADREERYFRYYPIASEAECVQSKVDAFIERVFEGSAVSFFVFYIKYIGIRLEDRSAILAWLENAKRC